MISFPADPHLHRRALPGQFGETSDEKPGRGVAMGLRHDRMWKSFGFHLITAAALMKRPAAGVWYLSRIPHSSSSKFNLIIEKSEGWTFHLGHDTGVLLYFSFR